MLNRLFAELNQELGIAIYQFSPPNMSYDSGQQYRDGDWTYLASAHDIRIQRWTGPLRQIGSEPIVLPNGVMTPNEEKVFYECLKNAVLELQENSKPFRR